MNAPDAIPMDASPVEVMDGLWQWELEAFPEQAAFSADSASMAFALGDGRIASLDLEDGSVLAWQAHEGSCLCLAAHPLGGWISGGDDGRAVFSSPGGECTMLHQEPGVWAEHLSASRDGTLMAMSLGKKALVLDLAAGSTAVYGPARAAISGLCVSPAGGALAATGVGGVTLWDMEEQREPIELDLRGLNLSPAFSPDGSYLACGHQENTVHVLDLSSRKVFALSGLPAKPGKLAWSHDGGLVLHTGTKAVICWPVPRCFDGNPQPIAFAVQEDARMCALAANPRISFAACGFTDGTLLLAELKRFAAFPVPLDLGSPVSALAWSASGMHLSIAFEDGRVALLDLARMLSNG